MTDAPDRPEGGPPTTPRPTNHEPRITNHAPRITTHDPRPKSLVIVFTLVLDRQNCHGIHCWLEPVEGEITAGAEVDHQFAKIAVVLNGPANHGRVLKRQECFTDGEYSPFGGVDVFADEECVEAG